MDRLDARLIRDLNDAYGSARRELLGLITERRNALYTGTFTGDKDTRLRELARDIALLQQIDARLDALKSDAGRIIRRAWEDALEWSRGIGVEELEILLHGFNAEDVMIGLPGEAAVQLSLAAIDFTSIEIGLEEALNALDLSQAQVAAVLRAELRQGLLRGDSFNDLMKRLLARQGSVFNRGRLSAMLGARRTVITANNGGRQAIYEYWESRIPGLEKQAVAAIDENTTDCCLRVHGQIEPISEPYDLSGTPRFADKMMYPAFHWNCRTSSTAYHRAWERTSNLTTKDMVAAARAELNARRDGSRQEIHPAHATSRRN